MSEQIEDLSRRLSRFANDHGNNLCTRFEEASIRLVEWIDYFRGSQLTSSADVLVDGFQAAIIEACSYVAIGLVRPAVFSIRAEVDIACAWVFFKDHPVEWDRVESLGEGYKLPADVLKYLNAHYPSFESRLKLLRKVKSSSLDNPYRMLSAHVHAQNSTTMPPLVEPTELVQPENRCLQCIDLQAAISEYLGDIFLSLFADEWVDLPEEAKTNAKGRLTAKELKDLCA